MCRPLKWPFKIVATGTNNQGPLLRVDMYLNSAFGWLAPTIREALATVHDRNETELLHSYM